VGQGVRKGGKGHELVRKSPLSSKKKAQLRGTGGVAVRRGRRGGTGAKCCQGNFVPKKSLEAASGGERAERGNKRMPGCACQKLYVQEEGDTARHREKEEKKSD